MSNTIGQTNAPQSTYTIQVGGKAVPIPADNNDTAAQLDTAKDHHITEAELESFVATQEDGGTPPSDKSDLVDQTNEFACSVAKVPNDYRKGYHSYDSLIKDYDKLAAEHPDYIKKEVIGKSVEGRDMVAYKLSEGAQGDTSNKPGVVISALTHAREWATAEASLTLGHSLLDGIDSDPHKQARLKDGEIWIVPCANPDGLEYSRDHDNLWRKNREPNGTDEAGKPTAAIGVDLNRNYGENNLGADPLRHHIIFRPDSDTPENTADDFGETSDDPFSEVYRGKSPASEPEVAAMEKLELRPNIKGCIDMHSYGDDLLYPWSYTHALSPEDQFYKDLGSKINDATGYKIETGIGLYPNSGSSDIFQEANGIRTYTIEMGQSFQPNPSKLPEITGKAATAATIFTDEIIKDAKAGTLGPHGPILMPLPDPAKRGLDGASGLFAIPTPEDVRTDSSPASRYFMPD